MLTSKHWREQMVIRGASALSTLTLLGSVLAGTADAQQNADISRRAGNESETAVAINPTNLNNVVIVSNIAEGAGLFEAMTMDGGTTWTARVIANGDSLGFACCDASLAFDQFGNLFLSYINSALTTIELGLSTNGGQTWTRLFAPDGVRGAIARNATERQNTRTLAGVDQPTVVTGPGGGVAASSVWVTYHTPSGIEARGAPVTGLGLVGSLTAPFLAPGSAGGNFGDIAVGPTGQVMVTYQSPSGGPGPSNIFVNFKADGLGGGSFGSAILATPTNVGGFAPIPAQSSRTIDAEAGLAWDRTMGPRRGRVYLAYADRVSVTSADTDIFVRFSDNNGATWSVPVRVNNDATTNSQFLQRIAIDQTTGNIVLSWHDARNDMGDFGPGDTNGIPNDDAQFWGTVSTDGGVTFAPNVQLSADTSNAGRSGNSIEFGDYTGLDFRGGIFYPAWADNSNSTGDNPDGTLSRFDIYTMGCPVATLGDCDQSGPIPAVVKPTSVRRR